MKRTGMMMRLFARVHTALPAGHTILLFILACDAGAICARAATLTWTNNAANGNWNVAANWSPNAVPGTNDTAIFSSASVTVTLTSPAAVGNFQFSNGTLAGPGPLTVLTNMTWNTGDLEGNLTLAPGSTLTESNNVTFALLNYTQNFTNTATLTNYGTVLWAGTGQNTGNRFGYGGGGAIYNAGMWEFAADNTGLSDYDNYSTGGFINTGTVEKTGGTNTSTITWDFINNNATVSTPAGMLAFNNWTGNGVLHGSPTLSSGTLSGTLASDAAVNFTGTIPGAVNVLAGGLLEWGGGDLEGSLTIQSGGKLAVSNNVTFALLNYSQSYTNTATLTNYGTVLWAGTGQNTGNRFGYGGGGAIYNAGLWEFAADNTGLSDYDNYSTGGFINTGTVEKTGGTNTSTVTWDFINNNASVSTPAGMLAFNNWTGYGVLHGSPTLSGGTLSGILASDAAVNFTGTIPGAVNVLAGGLLDWNGGDLEGSLTIQSGGKLAVSNNVIFALLNYSQSYTNTATLTNYGTVLWAGTGQNTGNRFGYGGGGAIYNAGLWQFITDGGLGDYDNYITGTFTNTGTLEKAGGTATSTVTWAFACNGGTVSTPAGALDFGNWTGGGTVHGNATFSGGTITGVMGSDANFNFTGTITDAFSMLSGATLDWNGGDLEGSLTVNAGATLTASNTVTFAFLNFSQYFTNFVTLTNYGTIYWAATGQNAANRSGYGGGGGLIYNAGSFQFVSDNGLGDYNGYSTGIFLNAGNLSKTGGIGTTPITWAFTQLGGTVNTPSGAVGINNFAGVQTFTGNATISSATINGSVTIAPNAVLNWNGGDLEGSLTVAHGGTLTVSNLITFAYLNYSVGQSNTVTLTNYGTVIWANDGRNYLNSSNQKGGGLIYNAGTWQFVTDGGVFDYYNGNSGQIINTGVMEKTGGTGTTTIEWSLANPTGVINTVNGQLSFQTWVGNNILSGNASISGGLINGAITIVSNSVINWNNADLESPLTVSAGAQLAISNLFQFAYQNYTSGLSNQVPLTNLGTVILAGDCRNYANSSNQKGGGSIYNAGLWEVIGGGTLDYYNANTGSFTNTGVFEKTNDATGASISWAWTSSGVTEIGNGPLTLSGTAIQTAGQILLDGGSLYVIPSLQLLGGVLAGTNSINGYVTNNGTISMGPYPGILSINGAYVQNASGTLDIKLGGLTAGAQYDRLAVSGNASLAGTLNVTLIQPYVPAISNTFGIMSYGTFNGSFATNNGLVFSTNLLFQETYLAGALNLVTATNASQSVTPPSIVSQPVGQTIINGQSASFYVTATGTQPLAYQWRFNGTNISSATGTSYTIANAQTNRTGNYVVVVTNYSGSVTSSVALLTVQPIADLVVQSITNPASANAGQPFVVTWLSLNQGGQAALGPWSDSVAISTNASGTNPIVLGTFSFTNNLGPGQSITRTQTIIAPGGLSGTYYVVVSTDVGNQVPEGVNENNNTSVGTTPLHLLSPDLQPVNLSTSPASAHFGDTIAFSWATTNTGSGPALSQWTDTVYLGPSANSLAGATPLASVLVTNTSLAANAAVNLSTNLTLPLSSQSQPGTYYLLVESDSGNVIAESDETNNLASRPITLSLPPLPDLAVTNVATVASATPGQTVTLTWGTTNQGTATASGAWSETAYLATNNTGTGTLIPLNTFYYTNTISPGGVVMRTQSVTVPITCPLGNVWFAVYADTFNQIVESNETNNLGVASASTSIPAILTVSLSTTQTVESSTEPITGWVTRNGPTSQALTVSLGASGSTSLSLPASVNIPAGESTAGFSVIVQDAGIVGGSQTVTITASASGFTNGSAQFVIADTDMSQLSLSLASPTVAEGGALNGTVTRDAGTNEALTVTFEVADTGTLFPPGQVTLAIGQFSTNFQVLALQNTLIEETVTNEIFASAPNAVGASTNVVILNNNIPTVTLTLGAASVSEAAGADATTGTLTRSPVTVNSVVIALASSNTNAAVVPPTVTIPAGAATATFPVGVIDDHIVDGPKTSTITAYVLATGSAQVVAQAASVPIIVTDADGPTLTLALASHLKAEGLSPATTATVSRNTSTTSSLVVTLASSDPATVTVPASVTIPSGATSVSFNVTTLNNAGLNGNETVTVTASAATFTSGVDQLQVSDVNLPDLVVASVIAAATADTAGTVSLGYQILNQGLSTMPSSTVTQLILLSTNESMDGAILAGEYTFTGTLPVGQSVSQTFPVVMPQAAGSYWVIVETDASNAVTEIDENNNIAISSAPIQVTQAYEATVSTTLQSAPANTPVPLTGRAFKPTSNQSVPFVPVTIHIHVQGTHREIEAITDSSGNFSTTWQPLPGEAGIYTIGAAYPGDADASAQAQFTLYGMAAQPSTLSETVLAQGSVTGMISIINAGDAPLSGLSVTTTNVPSNLTVNAALVTNSLSGLATNELTFTINAVNASYSQAQIGLIVTSAQGAVAQVPVNVTIQSPAPQLLATPGQLTAGVLVGSQKLVTFQVANIGSQASGPISVSLPALSWMTLASPNPIPSLAPGATNLVTLQLMPPAGTQLTAYAGNLGLNASGAGLSVPFSFQALSTATANLKVQAVDELTFYAAGSPPVTNATVTISDPTSGNTITNGPTDSTGSFIAMQLPEGYYNLHVTAPQHSDYQGTILVLAGQTNFVQAFVSFQAVTYTWTVVPTQIPDQYTVIVQAQFQANVPIPVVTIDPPIVDLANMVGNSLTVNLSISNHGLLAAQDCQLQFADHPAFTFTPLISSLGTLPANSSITIPVTVQRRTNYVFNANPGNGPGGTNPSGSSPGSGESAPCTASGQLSYGVPCGGEVNSYGAPVAFINAGNCGAIGGGGGGPAGGGGSTTGGGTGGYAFAGGGYSYSSPSSSATTGGVVSGGLTPAQPHPAIGVSPSCQNNSPANYAPSPNPDCGIGPILGDCLPALLPPLPGCLHGAYDCGESIGSQSPAAASDCLGAGAECLEAAGYEVPVLGSLMGLAGDLQCLNHLLMCLPSSSGGGAQQQSLANPAVALQPGVRNLFDMFNELTGAPDGVWVNQNSTTNTTVWLGQFRLTILSSSDGGYFITPAERSNLLASSYLPPDIPTTELNRVMDRWNRTQTNWMAGLFEPTNAPFGSSTDFISMSDVSQKLQLAAQYQSMAESGGFPDPLTAYIKTLYYLATAGGSGGVCGTVTLQLDQSAVMSREAFNATLNFSNMESNALTSVLVQITVTDSLGNIATNYFGIPAPQLSNLTAVNGTGSLAAGTSASANWTLVPTADAAATAPTVYYVGGLLQFSLNGQLVSVPLTPTPITVHPSPQLDLEYFLERDVYGDDPNTPQIEPSIPFSLGLMIKNQGGGIAHDFKITSAQPQIVDNVKGLEVNFTIIGSQVNGQNLTPSLTLDFGDIAPGANVIGQWFITSSLQGLFIGYNASYEEVNDFGNPKASLINNVSIHEMTHVVDAPGPFEDGQPDFLVNDIPDPNDYPDTLYLSDGSTNSVQVVLSGQVTGTLSPGNLQVQLTAPMPGGFVYLNVPDPANGLYQLAAVTRSDGVTIPFNTNVWVTDRTFVGLGRAPIDEYVLHLFDYNSPGTYTLTYAPLPSADTTPPSSSIAALPANSYAQIPVGWSGSDNPGGSGIAFYDIYVSQTNGPFTIWLPHTMQTSAIYQGALGSTYAFYSIATDAAGNRESTPLAPEAQTTVDLTNSPPVIQSSTNVVITEGQTATLTLPASDPDLGQVLTYSLGAAAPVGVNLSPASGLLTWATGANAGASTNVFPVVVTDNGQPPLSATGMVTIVVNAINHAPVLAPIPNFTVVQGGAVVYAGQATDIDLPTNRLTFSLTGTVPAGAAINPASGVFSWDTTFSTQPGTNVITVQVTDNGVPPLSDSQQFTVIVNAAFNGIEVDFGSTNLMVGESGEVSLILSDSLPLTNLQFQLTAPLAQLTNLTLNPVSSEVTAAAFFVTGSNNYALSLNLDPAQQSATVREIAVLDFLAVSNLHSAEVFVTPSQLLGYPNNGPVVSTNVVAKRGRIIIVGREPVLDASPASGVDMTLYGQPGTSYSVLSGSNLNLAVWNTVTNLILTNRSTNVLILPKVTPAFYRSKVN